MAIRSAFNLPPRSPLDFTGIKGRTKQSAKAECDINNILKAYRKTGAIAHLNRFPAQYAEAPSFDLREALEFLQGATAAFQQLPATVRSEFDNDPASFLEFVHNPANKDELVKMGLAERKPEPVVAGSGGGNGNPPT